MKLSANFDYTLVNHTQDNKAHLVISLEAPEIDWVKQRPKICILPVLDVSGSMQGHKLQYAKDSLKKLIEQLAPGDYSGLALFESRVRFVVEPGPVTPELKAQLLKAVDGAYAQGGTNFSDSIVESLSKLHSLDLPPSFLHRVVFFTDGQPTQGIIDQVAVKKLLTDLRGHVSLSFFGYGSEKRDQIDTYSGCDHSFLTELSDLGKGNYAYVQNPDDALAAFGKELGGLLSTYASDLKLIVEPLKGHKITKVITEIPHEEDAVGEMTLDLGDILAEETRHVVLEVLLEKQGNAFPRDTKVFEIQTNFMRVTQEGPKASESVKGSAKVRFVREAEAQTTPTKEVDAIVGLHQMVRAQLEAEVKVKQGDIASARNLMHITSKGLADRGHEGAAAAAFHTADLLCSLASYQTNEGYFRSMSRGTRSVGASSMSKDAQVLLSDAGVQLNNSSQLAYTSRFTDSKTSPGPFRSGK